MSLFAELKRRNVLRVGIAYVVVAWLVIQVADVMIDNIGAPGWVFSTILMVLGIGFPIALVFAWAFEMTPEGIKREHEVDRSSSIAPQTGRKLDRMIIGLLVLVAAYFIWESRFAGKTPPTVAEPETAAASTASPEAVAATTTGSPLDARKSIVVLPFVNMSNDPEQDYFSDGLSEEILNALVRIENLRVISRTSAFAFKGKDLSIPQIAEQLDVSHVLEGSVRKSGNDLRITAQLIEVDTDSHLWSQAYSRSLENVFEIQEDISRAIAGALELALADNVVAEKPTENLDAYQLFLRGRSLYQTRDTENLDRALDLLGQAVALDPQYDEAWANLAATTLVQAFAVDTGHAELETRSEQAAQMALQINPDNGLAHAVLGLAAVSRFEFELAMVELDRAIELDPQESNALLWKAIALSSMGYVDTAIEILQRAEAADPVFVNLQNWMVTAYSQKGDFEAARLHAEKAQQLDPEFPLNFNGEFSLSRGDIVGAREDWNANARREELPALQEIGRLLYDALEDPAKREQSIGGIIALGEQSSYYGIFWPLYRLGAADEAIRWIRQLREQGRGLRAGNELSALWMANDRKQLSHPALPAFFEEIGFADYWRAHGDPDYCRVDGENITCESDQ
jgi:TolB-like protein/Flp pilus assembly protein TadD